MKKLPNENKNDNEIPPITITTTLEEPYLLKILVEKLAERNFVPGYCPEQVPPGRKAIETSSVEAFVSGNINLSSKNDLINMPFDSCFLFICTKAAQGKYDLKWSSSLS